MTLLFHLLTYSDTLLQAEYASTFFAVHVLLLTNSLNCYFLREKGTLDDDMQKCSQSPVISARAKAEFTQIR